jgi:hypothetical protein
MPFGATQGEWRCWMSLVGPFDSEKWDENAQCRRKCGWKRGSSDQRSQSVSACCLNITSTEGSVIYSDSVSYLACKSQTLTVLPRGVYLTTHFPVFSQRGYCAIEPGMRPICFSTEHIHGSDSLDQWACSELGVGLSLGPLFSRRRLKPPSNSHLSIALTQRERHAACGMSSFS